MKKILFGIFIIGFIISLFFMGRYKSTSPINYSSLKYNFNPGEERIFDVSQSIEISFLNQTNTSPVTSFKLNGTLIQRVYQVKNDFVLLGVKIEDLNQNILKKELSKEIFLKISPNGKILNFLFPKAYSIEASNIIKSIMTAIQIILPEKAQSKDDLNYQLTELSINGPVQSEYKILFQKKISIVKTFLKYDFIGLNELPESEIIFLPGSDSISV